jgi:G3E family GTPase
LQTSTLKNLLENTDNIRIGVIVNDVAEVNIDAKLISGVSQDGTMIELQNGCACCSLADEFITAVSTLLKKRKNPKYPQLDAVVIELSGVADPLAIRANWKAAVMSNHPATELADIQKVVTLVDSTTFGSDWMTQDIVGIREGWITDTRDCAGERQVTELLAEQVEAADLILINKVDMASDDEVTIASSVARSLNPKANIRTVAFGKISPRMVLLREQEKEEETELETHSHDHATNHKPDCQDPICTDATHSHDHTTHQTESHDPACTDVSHSHDHTVHESACQDPACMDATHSHDHAAHESACQDPTCTDPSHSHDHSHRNTHQDELNLTNFVYKRDRPFDTKRLLNLLNQWPVPIKDTLDLNLLQAAQESGYSVGKEVETGNPFLGVLRSKGFIWLAPLKWMGTSNDGYRHDTAMYWSQAGKHFGITAGGKWWSTIPKEQIKNFFPTDDEEYDRILREDFVSEEWGDRRQGKGNFWHACKEMLLGGKNLIICLFVSWMK